MWRYAAKRLVLGAATVLVITFVVYLLLYLLPVKPWTQLFHQGQTAADRQAIIHRFGGDEPFLVQYWTFLRNLLHGDLGDSILEADSVAHAILVRMPNTIILMGSSYILALVIAIPIGVISAVRRYSRLDNAVTALSFFGISIPNFWFGSLLIYAFAIFPYEHGYPKIFPQGGIHTNGVNSVLDGMWHLVLPMIVLAVQSIAVYSRYMRSAMLDVLAQDYIRTARAKGLAGTRVVVRHAFRNSLLPLITLMGIDIPTLFVGAVVTEFVFNWPGMGLLFVQAADDNDYSILLGILLILSVFVVLGNLIADLTYALADPRISYEAAR